MIRPCPNCQFPVKPDESICRRCGRAAPQIMPYPTPEENRRIMWQGIGAAQVAALVMYLFDTWLVTIDPASRGYAGAVFTVIPFAMGIVSAFIWRNHNFTIVQHFMYSCTSTLLSIVLAGIFLQEGAICLLIASPLLMVAVWGVV